MANQMIYKKDSDAQLWEDTRQLAMNSGRSLSDVVAAALRAYVGAHHAPQPRAARVEEARFLPTVTPVPNPFAAKD